MRVRVALVLGMCLVTLVACTASPSVKYKDFSVSGPDLQGYTKFTLQSSAIRARVTIVNPAETQPGQEPALAISLESVPMAFGQARYGVRDSGSDWWIKTEVKLTTRDNTDLVEKLQVEFFDNRQQTIKEAGALAATLLAFAPDPPGDIKNPTGEATIVFDLSSAMKPEVTTEHDISLSPATINPAYREWHAKIHVGPIPPDAVQRSSFDPTEHTSVYFYSACRDTLVKLYDEKRVLRAMKAVKVADPSFIQTVALPKKGSISSTSECGVSVTSESKPATRDLVLLNEVIQQVKAVLAAEKKGGSGTTASTTGK